MVMIDLTLNDIYPGYSVPDGDVEVTLRVLRTLGDLALRDDAFDPVSSAILLHAHRVILKAVEDAQPSAGPRGTSYISIAFCL